MVNFKLYFDKDEEQKWLNEMSDSGWAFKKFFLGFYWFEACEPGEYRYQIDLLDNWSGDKEEYASFMKEMDVDVICQWYRWVFLRKTSDSPFEMYTDVESKIAQYTRIKKFFTVGFVIEMICLFVGINEAIRAGEILSWGLAMFIGIIALIFLRIRWKCSWKIKELKRI